MRLSASMPFSGWTDAQCSKEIMSKTSPEDVLSTLSRLNDGGGDAGALSYESVMRVLLKQPFNYSIVTRIHDLYISIKDSSKITPNRETYCLLIKCQVKIANAGFRRDAVHGLRLLLKDLMEYNIPYDDDIIRIVLQSCAVTRDEGLAHSLISKAKEVTPAMITHLAIASFTTEGFKKALAIMEERKIPLPESVLIRAFSLLSLDEAEELALSYPELLTSQTAVVALANEYRKCNENLKVVSLFQAVPNYNSNALTAIFIRSCTTLYAETADTMYIQIAEKAHSNNTRNNESGAHIAIVNLWTLLQDIDKASSLEKKLRDENHISSKRLTEALLLATARHESIES